MQGRFTSVDPLSSSAKLTDPQTFNRYSYVSNKPTVYTDPSGMSFHPGMYNISNYSGGMAAEEHSEGLSPWPDVPIEEASKGDSFDFQASGKAAADTDNQSISLLHEAGHVLTDDLVVDVTGDDPCRVIQGVNAQLPASGPGFYTYGPENHRYGEAGVVALMVNFAAEWNESHPDLPIGIGDLSLRGGGDTPRHTAHEHGLNVDIRPLRTDGRPLPTNINDRNYSHDRTNELVQALRQIPGLRSILFNDTTIPGVRHYEGHDNHLHLTFRPGAGCP